MNIDKSSTKQYSALVSSCGSYRYALSRSWDTSKPVVLFVCLNPSTADATSDDATSRVCMNYARCWGYGTLLIGNLFALRSTTPAALFTACDPIGPDNDTHLQQLQAQAALTICAWGNLGRFQDRAAQVLQLLNNLHCIVRLKNGQPGHPLYKPANLAPIPLY